MISLRILAYLDKLRSQMSRNDKIALRQAFDSACVYGNLSAVIKLFVQGYNDDINNPRCLTTACANGHYNIVLFLIKKGSTAHINMVQPLECACVNGHPRIVKLLLDNGAGVNSSWVFRSACESGNLECVKLLYTGSEYLAYQTRLLQDICSNNQLGVAQWLCDIRTPSEVDLNESFVFACSYGYLQIAQFLYNLGANVSRESLHSACEYGHTDVVKWLLSLKKFDKLQTFLTSIIVGGNCEIIDMIYDEKMVFDPDSVVIASRATRFHMVKWLISKGLDHRFNNDEALTIACTNGANILADYLVSQGCDMSRTSGYARKFILAKRSFRRWRRCLVRRWARKYLPVYYRPDMPGGLKAKRDLIGYGL